MRQKVLAPNFQSKSKLGMTASYILSLRLWNALKQSSFWHRCTLQASKPPYVIDCLFRLGIEALLTISLSGFCIFLGIHFSAFLLHHCQCLRFRYRSQRWYRLLGSIGGSEVDTEVLIDRKFWCSTCQDLEKACQQV